MNSPHPDDFGAADSDEGGFEPPAEWFTEAAVRSMVEAISEEAIPRLPHPSRRTGTDGLTMTSAGRPAESLVNVGGIAPRRDGDSEDSAAVLNLLLANLPLGVGVVDSGGFVVRANDGLEHLLGCAEAVPLTSLLVPEDGPRVMTGLRLLVNGDRGQWRAEVRTPIDGIEDRWISLHLIGVASPGQTPGTFMLLVSDVDERLRHHISSDPTATGRDLTTGLLDGASFEARATEALARATVSGGAVGLVRVSVEVTGRPAEDATGTVSREVRRETARRLASVVRTTDTLAHLGGGSFAVLAHLTPENGNGALESMRRRVADTLAEPVVGGVLLVEPAVGIGTALGVDREPFFTLLERATPQVASD